MALIAAHRCGCSAARAASAPPGSRCRRWRRRADCRCAGSAPGLRSMPGRAVLHEADAPVVAGEFVVARARHQKFVEHRVVGLVAGGVDVGDVVGDDVELAPEHDLPRQSDEKSILHRYTPPQSLDGAVPRHLRAHAATSPKPRQGQGLAEAVPMTKVSLQQILGLIPADRAGGQKQPSFTLHPAKISRPRPASKYPLTIPT